MPDSAEHQTALARRLRPDAPLTVFSGVGLALLTVGSWLPAWSRDEAATVMVVRRPLDQVWRTWAFDPALEPYYLLGNGWASISGGTLWLRLPSILATTVTAALLVLVARRFASEPAALLTGTVFLLLPAVTRYATEARPYAGTMLLATLTVHLWLTDRRLSRRRQQVVLITALVLLGLLHAYALLILPAIVIVTILTSENLGVELVRLAAGILRPPGAPVVGGVMLLLAVIGLWIGVRRAGPVRTGGSSPVAGSRFPRWPCADSRRSPGHPA